MAVITAICASPPLPNPGMASVDLALFSFLKRLNLSSSVKFGCLYTPEERNPNLTQEKKQQFENWQELPFKYECVRDNLSELYEKSNIILFWGDFLHSRDYLLQISSIYQQIKKSRTENDNFDAIYQHLYLSNFSIEIISRVLIFGGTLIFNRERDYYDKRYITNLSRLIKNSHKVWMRDIYSSFRANRILGEKNSNTLGVDCSFLLRNEDLQELKKSNFYSIVEKDKAYAGVFFGRSCSVSIETIRFVKNLCENLGVVPEWLPWFAPFTLPNHLPKIVESFPELITYNDSGYPLLGDLLTRIAQYRFIVTDTYHVCLNAWRLGVPAICISEILSPEKYDVSSGWKNAWRDKRQTFYFTYDAMEFFVYREELLSPQTNKDRLDQLTDLLKHKEFIMSIVENIKSFSREIENALVKEIKILTG